VERVLSTPPIRLRGTGEARAEATIPLQRTQTVHTTLADGSPTLADLDQQLTGALAARQRYAPLDIIANNQIDQKVVELSSSQQYFLVENSLYRSVFSSSRGRG